MIAKYGIDKSKFQRARLKKKGVANFIFLRWERCAWILRSTGMVTDDIVCDDRFFPVMDRPIEVKVSDDVQLKVGRFGVDKRVSVRMCKDTYQGFKALLWDVAKVKSRERCVREFDKINGLPAWKGIIEQKVMLAAYLVKQARRHQVKLAVGDLRVNTKRKVYPVWVEVE